MRNPANSPEGAGKGSASTGDDGVREALEHVASLCSTTEPVQHDVVLLQKSVEVVDDLRTLRRIEFREPALDRHDAE